MDQRAATRPATTTRDATASLIAHELAKLAGDRKGPNWIASVTADVLGRAGFDRDRKWLLHHHPGLPHHQAITALAARHRGEPWPSFVAPPDGEPEAWSRIITPEPQEHTA